MTKLVAIIMTVVVGVWTVQAAIPRTLSYQGILTDVQGVPKPDGTYSITFRLYTSASGGTAAWSEVLAVQTRQGLFSATLGSNTPFPSSLVFDQQYWLSLQVDAEPELSPRIALTSVSSSFSAIEAEVARSVVDSAVTANGIASGQVVKSINALRDHVVMRGANGASVTTSGDTITITAAGGGGGGGISTLQNTNNTLDIINPAGPTTTANVKIPLTLSGSVASPNYLLTASNSGNGFGIIGQSPSHGVVGIATATTGENYGVIGNNSSPQGTAVFGWNFAATGSAYGLYGRTNSVAGTGVRGLASATSGNTYGVYGQSNSPDGYAVFGYANSSTGENYGVYGQTPSTSGRGVMGFATATSGTTYGGRFESHSTSGRGVFGLATAASGATYGGLFESYSTGGLGVHGVAYATSGSAYGVAGESRSTSGRGVFGLAAATSGVTYGVRGESYSTSGRGVFGLAAATSGFTYGGYFHSSSTSGTGVFGWATATSGFTYGGYFHSSSTSGTGVFGYATAPSGGPSGVYGRSDSPVGFGVAGFASSTSGTNYGVWGQSNSPDGYGVYASGRFAATGTKSFQIDHPLNPENYYLNHFCAEGPEPMNAYSGNVVTDANGYATITLPDYFESINRDVRYQLTIVDDGELEDFMLVKVVRKIQNNRFTIRTSAPKVEVSWRVEAIRNDRYVQQYGFQAVQEKEHEIKGKYLQPELYGMPKEQGIHYRPDTERLGPTPQDTQTPPRE